MHGLFITGTNTGVGKTVIAVKIVNYLVKYKSVKVRKPVETGCMDFAKDAQALAHAAASKEDINTICPFQYTKLASAEDASHNESEDLFLSDLANACNYNINKKDFVVIEGAGGFYSPIAKGVLNSDLAKKLALPVILVVNDELGGINQALLAIEAIKNNNLVIKAVVLNQIEKNNLDNYKYLVKYTNDLIVKFESKEFDRFLKSLI